MKRLFWIIVPVLLLGGLISWRLSVNASVKKAGALKRQAFMTAAVPVTLATAEMKSLVKHFHGVGTVVAPLDVQLSPKVTGRILSVQGQPGDRVTAGETLVQIDPSDVQAQVNQAKANLAQAQYRLTQAELTQNATNVTVNSQITQARAALATAIANDTQVRANYQQQVAAAEAAVTDAEGRVSAAESGIESARAQVKSAQANLENAQAQYRRTHSLFVKGYVAAQDVDTADTAVKVQAAALQVAQTQVASATAALNSQQAEKHSAQREADITRNTGLANIQSADAQDKQAQAALNTAVSNTSQKPAYVQNLAALRATVQAAAASLADSEVLLSDTTLSSPTDGFVSQRYMDPGSVATAGTPILAIQFVQQVWVTIPVPEEDERRMHLGMPADITFDALPGQDFTGMISQIPISADPVTRQFAVRIIIQNPQGAIKPGMYARVDIITERSPMEVVVPPEAVHKTKTGTDVTVVDNMNIAHDRPVVVGSSGSDGATILQGLQPGEKVVVMTANTSGIKDGQHVLPQNSSSVSALTG